jgi:hypothetical protein
MGRSDCGASSSLLTCKPARRPRMHGGHLVDIRLPARLEDARADGNASLCSISRRARGEHDLQRRAGR